jgi:hypothetical protein
MLADGDAESQLPKEVGAAQNTELSHVVPLEHDVGTAEKLVPSDNEEAPKREYVTGIKKAMILGPITLTYFLFFLDLAVLSTATPAITSRFNSLVDVGWYVSERSRCSSSSGLLLPLAKTCLGMAVPINLAARHSSL